MSKDNQETENLKSKLAEAISFIGGGLMHYPGSSMIGYNEYLDDDLKHRKKLEEEAYKFIQQERGLKS